MIFIYLQSFIKQIIDTATIYTAKGLNMAVTCDCVV